MLKLLSKVVLFILACSFSPNILSITVKSLVMVHPQSKKRVKLLHDAHASYLKMLADSKQQKLISEIQAEQTSSLAALTNKLLNADSKQGAQTVVITETSANSFGTLVEQEAGAAPKEESQEILEFFPRMFLRKLLASGSTVDEKLEIFKKSIQPFNNVSTASFVLNNKLRWVAGDRNRTEHDSHLSFTVYMHWNKIIQALKSKEKLPKELEELRIASVKEYVDQLHDDFKRNGIADPYRQKIMEVIDAAVITKKVKESDHLAHLHKYLIESGKGDIRDEFNNNMIAFISQKLDSELLAYFNEFEKDPELNSAFLFAGSEHCDQIRNALLAKGYTVVEKAGLEDNISLEECLKDNVKLTALLKKIKTNSSF